MSACSCVETVPRCIAFDYCQDCAIHVRGFKCEYSDRLSDGSWLCVLYRKFLNPINSFKVDL
jgi:hypothetical protein